MNPLIEYIRNLLNEPADAAKLKDIFKTMLRSGTTYLNNNERCLTYNIEWNQAFNFVVEIKHPLMPLDSHNIVNEGIPIEEEEAESQDRISPRQPLSQNQHFLSIYSATGDTVDKMFGTRPLPLLGIPLTEVAQLLAVLWANESHNSPDDWCEKFLTVHNSTTGWKNFAVYLAFTILARHRKWSPKQQAKFTKTILGWKTKKYHLCPLANTIFPDQLGYNAFVEGKERRVLIQPFIKWLKLPVYHYDPIPMIQFLDAETTARRTRKAPNYMLGIGWLNLPNSVHYLRSINGLFATELPDVVRPILIQRFGEFCECPECHSLVKKFIIEGCCTPCGEKKYPNIQIKAYDTNPLNFLKVQTDKVNLKPQFARLTQPILMGCELEYMCKEALSIQTRLNLLKHLSDFIIFKSDASIPNHGFEIVTAPATLPVHRQRFMAALTPFPAALSSSEKTGMHIHLTRSVITPLTNGRMLDFLNNPENRDFVELVGERKLTSYCEADSSHTWANVLNPSSVPRHSVLNLSKTPTIEFRFFQAPLSFNAFLKNLEFVQTLLEFFTAGVTIYTPKESRHHSTFIKYVSERNKSRNVERNTCPNLFVHLKAKGAI